MGNDMGLWQKVRIAWYWFREPARKNVLIVTCEHCGGTNITVSRQKNKGAFRTLTYKAAYKCCNCGAKGAVCQVWRKGGRI